MTTDYESGREAALAGKSLNDCPFTYANSGKPPQWEFDRDFRPRMDAWFQGWLAHAPPVQKRPARGGWKRTKLVKTTGEPT